MLIGAITPILGIGVQQMAGHCGRIGDLTGRAFWLNFITLPWGHVMTGREIAFLSVVLAIFCYVGLSLLTCRQSFNMQKLLRRGPYAVLEDQAAIVRDEGRLSRWARALGWDKHFTRGDKWISGSLSAWSVLSFFVLAGGTLWNLTVRPWSLTTWSNFWQVYVVILPFIIGSVVIVWLTWGVVRDLGRLFRFLREAPRNDRDDGVVGPRGHDRSP